MNYFYINSEIDKFITVSKVKDSCDTAADCSNELIRQYKLEWIYFCFENKSKIADFLTEEQNKFVIDQKDIEPESFEDSDFNRWKVNNAGVLYFNNELISEADDQWYCFNTYEDALNYWIECYLENLCIWWFDKNFGDEE